MKKLFLVYLFCLLAPFVLGEEFFVSKPNEKEGKYCQAVQVANTWFLTAAHCVADICNDACEIEMNIHSNIIKTSEKNVFWLNSKRIGNSSYDIALINFDSAKTSPDFKEHQILIVDNSINISEPKILNRSLNIPFNIRGNVGEILSINDVFYGPKSRIIFTKDLGIFHGLSGAGVFTNKGELIAVTSAVAGRGSEARFSVFSVFDEKVKSFLKQRIPSLYFKHLSSKDFKDADTSDKEILISLDNNK